MCQKCIDAGLSFANVKFKYYTPDELVSFLKTLSPDTTSPVAEEESSPGSLEVVFHDDQRNSNHYPFDANGWKGWCISKTGTVDMLLLMFTDHREIIPMVNIKKIVVTYNSKR